MGTEKNKYIDFHLPLEMRGQLAENERMSSSVQKDTGKRINMGIGLGNREAGKRVQKYKNVCDEYCKFCSKSKM